MSTFIVDLSPRVIALKGRHRSLDLRIEQEQRRPLPNQMLIRELKRSKLAVKEEISALERKWTPSAA